MIRRFCVAILPATLIFACSKPKVESSEIRAAAPGDALLTFLNGEKCLLRNGKFLYQMSYLPQRDEGAYTVVQLEPRVLQEIDLSLHVVASDGASRSISKDEISQIQFQFLPKSVPTSFDIRKVILTLKNGEKLEFNSNGQHTMMPDSAHNWNMDGKTPTEIYLKGDPDQEGCLEPILGDIRLDKTFVDTTFHPIRVQFF